MKTYTVFAYGTLRKRPILEGVLGRPYDGPMNVGARLRGFKKYRGYAYPWIIEAEGSSVAGILLHGLTEADLAELDRYEGVHRGLYVCKVVKIRGEHVLVYVAGKLLRDVTLREIRRAKGLTRSA